MSYTGKPALKRFFIRFALLAVILIVLDFLIGSAFKHYYFKQKSGLLYRTTYAIDNTRADFLVFGSSRANHHYVPAVFEKALNTTFYNCGRDGCNLIYHAAVISAVLQRYTPENVIIDLTPNELSYAEEGKLSPLLPYKNNPAVLPYVKYNSKFECVKLLSKMYPYNSLLTNIIVGNLSSNKKRSEDNEGYIPLYTTISYSKITPFKQDSIINDRVKILDELLNKLVQKHVKVTVVISPAYYSFTTNDTNANLIKKLCIAHSVSFINYENNPDYKDYRLYSDNYHLNNTGALKFSEDLIKLIYSNNNKLQ